MNRCARTIGRHHDDSASGSPTCPAAAVHRRRTPGASLRTSYRRPPDVGLGSLRHPASAAPASVDVSMSDRLLTNRRVADFLRISPETVLRGWRASPVEGRCTRRCMGECVTSIHRPPSALGQRLHEHQDTPDTDDVEGDDGEIRRQAESDPSPVSTGWLGCHRLEFERRIAALEDSTAHCFP